MEPHDWLADLMAVPAREWPLFEAALSLMLVLCTQEAVELLRERAGKTELRAAGIRGVLDKLRGDLPAGHAVPGGVGSPAPGAAEAGVLGAMAFLHAMNSLKRGWGRPHLDAPRRTGTKADRAGPRGRMAWGAGRRSRWTGVSLTVFITIETQRQRHDSTPRDRCPDPARHSFMALRLARYRDLIFRSRGMDSAGRRLLSSSSSPKFLTLYSWSWLSVASVTGGPAGRIRSRRQPPVRPADSCVEGSTTPPRPSPIVKTTQSQGRCPAS